MSNCNESHSSHYCNLCRTTDSTHFAKDCPEGVTLYHGTRVTNITSILNRGLNPSQNGRLGAGIYFTGKDEALKISSRHGTGTGVAVIECKVNLLKVKDYGNYNGFNES